MFGCFLNGCEKDLKCNALAVLVQAFDRTPAITAPPRGADRPSKSRPVHCPIFLGHDQVDGFPQGLFWGVAEQSLGARVPEADAAIRAGIDDRRMAVSRKRGAKSLKMRAST
jgi:hypothetical protein